VSDPDVGTSVAGISCHGSKILGGKGGEASSRVGF